MIPKFRAWDKFYECMITPAGIKLKNEEISHIIERLPGETTKSSITYYELLQSTGLKDKNDVEIFEGDIVSCFNEGVSTVVFRYGTFGLLCNGYFESFINVLGSFEILGNIYENGDLLK